LYGLGVAEARKLYVAAVDDQKKRRGWKGSLSRYLAT
jgi:hypothetical protein